MTNGELLRRVITDRGVTITAIAKKLGCSRPRVYNILDGRECMASEISTISDMLRLTAKEKNDIFFANKVV